LGGENTEEGVAHGYRQASGPRDCSPVKARQTLLNRILELHIAGRTAEDIASQVLTNEPENVMFRGAMLVEIVLHYAGRRPEEKHL